jgi:hypothetical protein
MALVIIISKATVRLGGVNMSSPWKVCNCTPLCRQLQVWWAAQQAEDLRLLFRSLLDQFQVFSIIAFRIRARGRSVLSALLA